ncbi:XAC2610-related protein [Chitinophaga alhagiae]|uniref:XAC2610-related protein n=1 Tax=Chitinophaga alhagiae TaxID=2203219 RepID=UPI0013005372|nr:hypothetical protein [Chitinophaga alhagiae]
MKPLTFLAALLLPLAALAQTTTILVTNSSGRYNARITAVPCEGNECKGEAKVQLLEKERNRAVQTFTTEHMIVRLDSNRQKGEKQAAPAEGQYPLIFDDFNFDGEEDVAIRNGNNGSYGGLSYDVYVYNKARKTFTRDKWLTTLASENLGMFETDRRRRQLTVRQKDGCCWHATIVYGMNANQKMVKVEEITEDARDGGDMVTVTTSRLENGKMKKTVKQYKTSEYYKENR